MERDESAPPPFPPSEIHAKLMGKNWMPEEIFIDFTFKNLLPRGEAVMRATHESLLDFA